MISSALPAPPRSGSEAKWTPSYVPPVARPWQPLAVLTLSLLVLIAVIRVVLRYPDIGRVLHEPDPLAARMAELVFFGVACVAVWVWAYHLFGGLAAVCATALYTSVPVVLAQASPGTGSLFGRTPVPLVALGVIGSLLIVRRAARLGWTALIPLACAAFILPVGIPWNIAPRIGYILAVFALVSIPAGYGLACLLRSPRLSLLILGAGLLVGEMGLSFLT